MIRVLIVDDDALIHVTLRSMITWEKYGYTVVQDCSNGNQALNYLKDHTVDLLITDIKMPGMNGLELMRQLRQRGRLPVTVALSGYDEFELVREAFRLGAYDYLLKADINNVGLERLLKGLRQKIFRDIQVASPGAAVGKEDPELTEGAYLVAAFRVHDFEKAAQRFGDNLRQRMEKPMLELVHQIHRLQGRAVFRAKDPGYYELYYPVRDKNRVRDTMVSVVQQIQGVWRDYMNLEAAAGISDVVSLEEIPQARQRCETLCRLSVLQGVGKICTQWQFGELAQAYEAEAGQCEDLIAAVCSQDNGAAQTQISRWFSSLKQLGDQAHMQKILILLTRLSEGLRQYGQNYFLIFPEEMDALQVLQQFDTRLERELWLRNLLRRVQASCEDSRNMNHLSAMERAKRFMQDNFNNPELSLRTVADYVGFNEKYFSTRFTKECGCTFIVYLNDLRIRRAQELLTQTDMKMYEISEAVGYGSVEHFNHIFKKKLCISPSEFRKSQEKS